MKRTAKYALATVLGALVVAPFAAAQDNFPDVPDNHWAFEALARLKKDGILVGYPDGKYRGARPASRYELAVAIHAAYVNLKNVTDGLQAQIDALKGSIGTGNGGDIQSLRDALTALQNEQSANKAQNIRDLQALSDRFQKELSTLGVDVEQMKKDLADLNDRVTTLERNKPKIDVSGDVSLWVGGGVATEDNEFGITTDARITGLNSASGQPEGFPRDLTILHEAAVRLTTTNTTGPRGTATIVFGNMLGPVPTALGGNEGPFGNQSRLFGGYGYSEGSSAFYIQELAVVLGGKALGTPITAEIGRVGYKVSPYLFQRPDVTSYFDNERWDNGKWLLDGAILGFNFGSVGLEVVGGRNSNRLASNGVEIQPTFGGTFGSNLSVYQDINGLGLAGPLVNPAGQFQIDRTLGVTLKSGFSGININASYLLFDSDTGYTGLNSAGIGNNRISAYGVNLDTNFAGLKLEAGYNATDLLENGSRVNTGDNAAYFGKIGYARDKFGIYGAYREVEAKFLAPGDWGRLGLLRNPVNIRGFQVGGFVNFGQAIKLTAKGEFDRGASDNYGLTNFDEDTEINSFDIGLDFRLSGNTSLMLGYEDTRFSDLVSGGPDAKYRWYTVGLGYGLSDAAKLKIQYQMSDVENDFVVGPFLGGGVNRFRGGFISSTLSLKF